MTIEERLNAQVAEIENQKLHLAETLRQKGVAASDDETYNTLVPKALEIADATDYFNFSLTGAWTNSIKKLPTYTLGTTSMANMFTSCPVSTIDISLMDTANVTTTSACFRDSKITTIQSDSIKQFSVCSNYDSMFSSCNLLTQESFSKFNFDNHLANVYASASHMFYNCALLEELDMTGMTLYSTDYMFYGCKNLQRLLNINAIRCRPRDMQSMFASCSKLETIDLSGIDTSQITSGTYYGRPYDNLFSGCTNLKSITGIANFRMGSGTSQCTYTFSNCTSLEEIDISGWNFANCYQKVGLTGLFNNCTSLRKIDMRSISNDGVGVNINSYTFAGIPADCLIIVRDSAVRDMVLAARADLTNVKTVEEYESEVSE